MFYEVIVSSDGVPCEVWQAEGDSPEHAASCVQSERDSSEAHEPEDTYDAVPLRTGDDILREGITPVDVARILACSGWSLLRESNGSVVARRDGAYCIVYDPTTPTRAKEAKLLSEALGWEYFASPGVTPDWPADWPHAQIVRELDELAASRKSEPTPFAIVDDLVMLDEAAHAKTRAWYELEIPPSPGAKISRGSVQLPANLSPDQAIGAFLGALSGGRFSLPGDAL